MKIDTTLMTQLRSKVEQIVREGHSAEKREQDGYTNEYLIKKAKETLQVEEDSIIASEYEGILKKYNKEANLLITLSRVIVEGEFIIPESTIKELKESRDRLLNIVATNFGVNKEELIEEGE